jgi:hypothetical protein
MTDTYIQIGCKLSTLQQWKAFTDEEIDEMDTGALKWWKTWKSFILSAHDNAPKIY